MQRNCAGNNLEVKALCNVAMAELFPKIKVLFLGRGVGDMFPVVNYSGADKSVDRPGRKQATAAEDFDFRISCL
jgi:hypothetical protein